MASSSLEKRLRGLVLSAVEIKALTGWPEAMIEDYLTIIENIIAIAATVDIGANADIQTVTTDYTTERADGVVLIDAGAQSVTVFLGADAIQGQNHELKCKDDTFTCIISPNGNGLDGVLEDFELIKDEAISVRADKNNDWWIV